ncbi:MAG: hypothetical protein NTX99_06290 [Candidatus Aminicenantes bacterium]|nr:hypothetical protein [Candidatus Aminicenantes bacterium]
MGTRAGTLRTRIKTFKRRHPMRSAALFLGLVGAAYAVTAAALAAAGAVPTAPVIAGLDVDNYYAYQILFILPLVYAVWVLTSGVLLALGTRGCHRSQVLVAAARAWGGPLLLAWTPSAVQAAFAALGMGQAEWVGILSDPGFWQTLYIGVYAAAAVWAVVRFVLAARGIHKKSWLVAILTGLAAAAVAVGIFVLFVR